MKKRTKEILSGVLALSILLSTPAGMEAAQAGRIAAVQTASQTERGGKETESTNETEVTEGTSEIISEIAPKDEAEPPKEQPEGTSETISEEISNQTSENKSDSELIPEESTETESTTEEEWVEIPATDLLLEISDDGELDYREYVDKAAEMRIKVLKSEVEENTLGSMRVRNCPLNDSDFYIELSADGEVQQYGYTEWIHFLENSHAWVNGNIQVKLSDTGKKYFDAIYMEEQEDEDGRGRIKYTFWAVNAGTNASTRYVENGTRAYTTGWDAEAPALMEFAAIGECYEPTRTDTEQYYAEDFVLKGTFSDDISGVCRIEYTTDAQSEDSAWTVVENTQAREADDNAVAFEITLTDGCYPAIAVRAYDEAGNVSETRAYVNDAGAYVRVVVDSAAPVLQFDLSAGGQPYSGENDNWTNKDVHIEVTADRDSCSYAGIYQCEYAYVKIGGEPDNIQNEIQDKEQEEEQDMSEMWTALSLQDKPSAEFTVTEDRNGYYLFRAVSKSGVPTTGDARQRVLIQHQAAEPKPLLVSGVDEAKRKNGWYNRQSGTPDICFEYPDYDTGVISGEYDAPITLHYELTRKDSVPDDPESCLPESDGTEKTAEIGVMSCSDTAIGEDGSQEFVLTKDDLAQHVIDFGSDDGFYTLTYWTTDRAGNTSEKRIYHYKIDCHAPTDLTMELAGTAFEVGTESTVTYREFYRDTVSGSAGAQYGISGKGSLAVSTVKKIGEWNDMDCDSSGSAEEITISPNTRCFLYIRAEDAAGNVAEGWTDGIVVDNMAPNESADGNHKELVIVPEGANEHGFFNADVTVDIRVMDAPEDGNCAALRSVTSSVGRDGADTVTEQELFTFVKDAPTEDEIVAASCFDSKQLIDAKANESNEAYIEVTAIDRSENIRTSTQMLKIDVTRPEIEISFDNDNAINENYYQQERTVTVHVHELNFDPNGVSVSVTKDSQVWETVLTDWIGDGIDHYASFALTEDGEYGITAHCVDLADNVSDTIQTKTFVIDRTAPGLSVVLTAGQGEQGIGREYFNTGVAAVITVTEHNFSEGGFWINMTPVSGKGTWSHEGDIHTLRIPFEGDNLYHIDCGYTDLAGNRADPVEKDFTIDTAAPVITIGGVLDGSANRDAILPVVSVSDSNIGLSDIAVCVRTGVGDIVEAAMETAVAGGDGNTEYRMTLTDMTEQADNIYYLTVSACDLAGNTAELTYRFSLNRNGSVYDLTSLMHIMEKRYNTYSEIGDIQIMEMNIDTVDEFALYVSRNGMMGYEADYTRKRTGSPDTGYTYLYQIKRENFAEEGIYRISLYSKDRAGNEVNNTTEIHGNEIVFVVDNTAPKVVVDGVESGMVYDVDTQQVHVVVMDNFKLTEAEFTLVNQADEVLRRWNYMEQAGENGMMVIAIPQCEERLSLLYRVKDAAGNEMQTYRGEQTALVDFLVTTDRVVQFIGRSSRTPLGCLCLGVAGAAVPGVAVWLFRRKCRRIS